MELELTPQLLHSFYSIRLCVVLRVRTEEFTLLSQFSNIRNGCAFVRNVKEQVCNELNPIRFQLNESSE